MPHGANTPLDGVKVVAHATCVAATYAARLLGTLGGDVLLLEPAGGTPLRREPPFMPCQGGGEGEVSALFAYLASGMTSKEIVLSSHVGQAVLAGHLEDADIFIDDTAVDERRAVGLDDTSIAARFPRLVHVSVLPFGASGPKANWKGDDIVVQHAGGEGNLLPNGLAVEMFPDRPPLKIAGHFGAMQGGIAAALGALSALWVRPEIGGQYVDISSQDANLAIGAFAVQRFGDGSIEHRTGRSFRYGGVIPCADGYVELLTLEQRQWDGLVALLGHPEWALDPALQDSLERGRQGPVINRRIRVWASGRHVEDIVVAGQKLGVPLARYMTPADILADPQERHRGLFQPVSIGSSGMIDMLVSPFHFDFAPLALTRGPPARDVTVGPVPTSLEAEA